MTPAGKPPWIGKEGGIDLLKIPIDSVLRRSVLEGDKEFRGACSVLRALYQAGRMEAGIYLYGSSGFVVGNGRSCLLHPGNGRSSRSTMPRE